MTLVSLPIDPILPEIAAALRQRPCVVVRAPTGAGKTTRLPPALLDAQVAGNRRILVLEPRRVAARAAARRMAMERGGRLGDEVGYQVRFDRQYGPRTRILVVTPGILLRLLQDDPFLESAGAVVFDEFHERGLESDLALGMVRLLQQTVRPDLRTVVMSATLAVEKISLYLGDCPVVSSEGRQYPVEVLYEPRPQHQPWPVAAALAAERLLDRTDGDLLVFLPGMQEIRQTARHLEDAAAKRELAVLPLCDALMDITVTPVDEQVAFRLDFPQWVSTYSDRNRGIILDLMAGERTLEVSDKYALSPGRVSQMRGQFCDSWRRFQDGVTADA